VDVLPEHDAYLVHTPNGQHRYDFKGLTDYLEGEQKEKRLTGIQISPGRSENDAPAVARLSGWASRKGLQVTWLPTAPKG
jgi:hypothetical protein